MPQLTPQLIIFFTLAGIAVVTALGVLISRSAVYSAILLVVNFTTVAFIYFILGAPFIGLAQITVYAGAIMVLFLFVIMMLGTENIAQYEPIGFQRIVTVFVGLIVIAEAVFMFLIKDPSKLLVTAGGSVVEVETIGMLLYQKYLLPFEITSFILLIAVVGAIVLTKQEKKKISISQGEAKL
jgi:NADH-quinone oxidoreductase subunit J